MQPDSFMPFYMFVSYTFFFFLFFFFCFFSIYTVQFGSEAHPVFYSSGTVGIFPMVKESYSFFLTFRGPCIVIYSYNKTNEMH